MQLYVGNLAYGVTESDLQTTFSAYGAVSRTELIKDKFSGQSKGFGFVEMSNNSEADTAIKALNGKPFQGRPMKVNPAQPRSERPKRAPRY